MEIQKLVEQVDRFSSPHDENQLRMLDTTLQQFFSCPEARDHLEVWFRLFERFPEDDGYEMFWTILHAIESQPNYEPLLVASVRRRPSRFPVTMINRILNAGQSQIGNVRLLGLLESVASDEACIPYVREDAQDFIKHHRERALVDQASPSTGPPP